MLFCDWYLFKRYNSSRFFSLFFFTLALECELSERLLFLFISIWQGIAQRKSWKDFYVESFLPCMPLKEGHNEFHYFAVH